MNLAAIDPAQIQAAAWRLGMFRASPQRRAAEDKQFERTRQAVRNYQADYRSRREKKALRDARARYQPPADVMALCVEECARESVPIEAVLAETRLHSVARVRARVFLRATGHTHAALAEMFGLSRATVSLAIARAERVAA